MKKLEVRIALASESLWTDDDLEAKMMIQGCDAKGNKATE